MQTRIIYMKYVYTYNAISIINYIFFAQVMQYIEGGWFLLYNQC